MPTWYDKATVDTKFAAQVTSDAATYSTIAALTAALARVAALESTPPVIVVPQDAATWYALGTSITNGVGATSSATSYRAVLAGLLGTEVRGTPVAVTNGGENGSTSAGMVTRIPTLTGAGAPTVVLIETPVNDFKDPGGLDPATTQANLRTIVQAVKAAGKVPVLMTSSPVDLVSGQFDHPLSTTRRATANALTRQLARTEGVLLADLEAAFGTKSLLVDGIHPNDTGHALIARTVLNTVKAQPGFTPLPPATTPVIPSGFTDNFDRADSTTSLGTASGGGAWTAVSGVWGITGGKGYSVTGSNDDVALVDAGSSDQRVSAVLSGDANRTLGLIARADAAANTYYVAAIGLGQMFVKNGGFSPLGAIPNTNPGDTIELDVIGSTITVKANGTTILTVTDTTLTTGTHAGLRMNGDSTTARVDTFAVAV